ncbi:hypothetical protein BSPWISOXPB_10596 [uncultured Gammaproteobacteria bacterium]|nr:hypothetical protein BSPWISOXPB_10596 [uncultured Gammaproteobacteria bacterium]
MRGYVVDVYFCVFDVSVEEFGVGFGFRLDLELDLDLDLELELDLELFWSMSAIWILPLPRVARTLVLELCLLLV